MRMRDFYQEIIDIIGAGAEACCVIPMGDPNFESADRTTLLSTGQGDLDGLTFTYEPGARTAFVNPVIYVRNQAQTPLVDMDGAGDGVATTPDAAPWSRDDTAGEGFSMGVFAKVRGTGQRTFLAKTNLGGAEEWRVRWTNTTDKLQLRIKDESANIEVTRTADVATPLGVPASFGITYTGAGGASAMDGAVLYTNGAVLPSAAANNASYVGMENLTSIVFLGRINAANYFNGWMMAPYFTHRVLSVTEELNIDAIYQDMYRARPSRLLAGVI